MHIAGVHGVGHYRSEATADSNAYWAQQWSAALSNSTHLQAVPSLGMAYYADLLLEPGRQSGATLGPDTEALIESFVAEWVQPELQPQGHLSWLLRYIADIISQRLGHDSTTLAWFLETFFPEVATFLRSGHGYCPQETIMRRVADHISGADIIIAHSLGSVVAYQTLWAHELEIPLLITMGSPLAMNGVRQLLRTSPSGQLARPPGVRRWVNVADVGDVVAIPIKGIARTFTDLDRDEQESIGLFDFHSAAGYLRSEPVAREIDTMAQTPIH